MDEVHEWCQIEGENSLWYGRFVDYRNSGPKRSILGTYHAWQDSEGKKRSKSPAKSWRDASSEFGWKERAEAWDSWQREETAKRTEAERERLLETELADYKKQLEKWNEVFDRTELFSSKKRGIDPKTGREIVNVELEVSEWHSLTRWRADISKIGRLALGLPDKIEKREHTGNEGSAIKIEFEWSDIGDNSGHEAK
jgi:hypothetical protein